MTNTVTLPLTVPMVPAALAVADLVASVAEDLAALKMSSSPFFGGGMGGAGFKPITARRGDINIGLNSNSGSHFW